ncbi:hypothetical protein NPIL_84411, partial [Nephila pilipes]
IRLGTILDIEEFLQSGLGQISRCRILTESNIDQPQTRVENGPFRITCSIASGLGHIPERGPKKNRNLGSAEIVLDPIRRCTSVVSAWKQKRASRRFRRPARFFLCPGNLVAMLLLAWCGSLKRFVGSSLYRLFSLYPLWSGVGFCSIFVYKKGLA